MLCSSLVFAYQGAQEGAEEMLSGERACHTNMRPWAQISGIHIKSARETETALIPAQFADQPVLLNWRVPSDLHIHMCTHMLTHACTGTGMKVLMLTHRSSCLHLHVHVCVSMCDLGVTLSWAGSRLPGWVHIAHRALNRTAKALPQIPPPQPSATSLLPLIRHTCLPQSVLPCLVPFLSCHLDTRPFILNELWKNSLTCLTSPKLTCPQRASRRLPPSEVLSKHGLAPGSALRAGDLLRELSPPRVTSET